MRTCKRCGKEKPLDQFRPTQHQCNQCRANNEQLRRLGVRVPQLPKGSVVAAAESPRIRDLAWAAGFLEGEGSFTSSTGTRHITVAAVQIEREPLDRLLRIFGGSIHPRRMQSIGPYQSKVGFHWAVNGIRARGVMMTLYTFMSQRRREQIRRAFQRHSARPAA